LHLIITQIHANTAKNNKSIIVKGRDWWRMTVK